MTNYKEILRMHCAGYSQRVIAKNLHCSRDAVSLCLKWVKEREITLSVSEKVTNALLQQVPSIADRWMVMPTTWKDMGKYSAKTYGTSVRLNIHDRVHSTPAGELACCSR